MLVQTILNRVRKIKGFVCGVVRFGEWEGDPTLEVEVRPRMGSRGICAGCGKNRRLLWVGEKRTVKTLLRFFRWLAEIVRHNLRTVRAYLLKEEFQWFWEYESPCWAGRFLVSWCEKTMRSRIEPMKRMARMVRNHRGLIVNWFRARKK